MQNADIAIIGMAGRFPSAPNVETLWQNLCNGVEAIHFLTPQECEAMELSGADPEELQDPRFVKAVSVLEKVEWFDAPFFGIPPREAEIMDPQHRIFLECAWEAFEDAGYAADSYSGTVGVYAGATMNTYLLCNLMQNPVHESLDLVQMNVANSHDFLTTRVSYKLNLRGPSYTVQSACSTSLVAVHLACQNVLRRECDMALAGGVSVNLKLKHGYRYTEAGMTSPDGHCRAFDKNAQGTVFGSGAGVIVVKKLDAALRDRDHIHAIIKGSTINNDGAFKVGYTAPSIGGQAEVISEALANAGVEPHTIGYIETHGTGTQLGDPIEFQALVKAFRSRTARKNFCALGSIKTNIGHLDAAAGVAGLIKAVLALKHRQIPPMLHFEAPNPEIDQDASPFFVNTKLLEWKRAATPRRAGVSAFGVGGTNAHAVLEEAPSVVPGSPSRLWRVLTFSARSQSALETMNGNLLDHLKRHPEDDLADTAFTLQVGRKLFPYRRFVLGRNIADMVNAMEHGDPEFVHTFGEERQNRPVVFMFPGQGSQYVSMGAKLYKRERLFRELIQQCSSILRPETDLDLEQLLYPAEGDKTANAELLAQTRATQPALFAVEYALAQLWISWGVRPQAMIGHSIGEFVAACIAGVFTLEDALKLVAARGKLIQELLRGAMLAVALPEHEAESVVGPQISLAAINTPGQCVLSGEEAAIDGVERQLQADGVRCQRLRTSHAFHSHMMDPALRSFAGIFDSIALKPPQIPYLSNLTGKWITAAEATDRGYWVQHLRRTVRFSQGMRELLREPNRVFLELGPGQALGRMANAHGDVLSRPTVAALLPPPDSPDHVMQLKLGTLWQAGVPIAWSAYYLHEQRNRVSLPAYPFERQRYWIEPCKAGARKQIVIEQAQPAGKAAMDQVELEHRSVPRDAALNLHPRPELKNPYHAPVTEIQTGIAAICEKVLGISPVGIHDNFFDLGGDSFLALQVVAGLREKFGIELPVIHLYESLTISGLADLLEEQQSEKKNSAEAEDRQREQRAARRKSYQQRERRKNVAI